MAAYNFLDTTLNNARTILRAEAPGSARFLVILVATLAVWVGASWVGGMTQSANSARTLQEGRYRTLTALAAEYQTMSPSARAKGPAPAAIDVPTVFAQVSERMALGTRVNRISPDGRNQSIEINRLYAEELIELGQQLAARGVGFVSVEIRSLPVGQERLLTISAIIGPMNAE